MAGLLYRSVIVAILAAAGLALISPITRAETTDPTIPESEGDGTEPAVTAVPVVSHAPRSSALSRVPAGSSARGGSTASGVVMHRSGVLVHPGMEIRQDANVCTLGFVDAALRIAFSAGHCRGSGPVTDSAGRIIGTVSTFRDNTPNGTVVRTDQVITDYETISLNSDVVINDILPGGRRLVAEASAPLVQGQPVCHFGTITGESCGSIERVNNGWFTMTNGVVSKKGDSGGPVYTLTQDGKAIIVGLFNCTWGHLPAAVSWQATGQQAREDRERLGVVTIAAAEDTQPVP